MSNHHHELAPASQPETDSKGFGHDATETQSFGNFNVGDDLQFGDDFFNFDAFTSDPFPGQFPEPFCAGADNQSQLPANDLFQGFHQLGPDCQVPSSAGAEDLQQQLTYGAKLPTEQTQHNLQEHHQQLTDLETQLSGDADDLEEEYSSEAESQVHEPQRQRLDLKIFQKFDQNVPDSHIPSAARAGQFKNQRSASAASLLTQPLHSIEAIRTSLANYLQTAGLTAEQKYQFVQTIPEDVMNELYGVKGMPPTQRRATVPQVPAPVPQQALPPARQPAGRSRVAAPLSRGPAALPRVPAPSFSDPAPLPRVRPRRPAHPPRGSVSFSQVAPQQSQRELSPTPSASSDGSLNEETYKPLIYYPEFVYDPNAPAGKYPIYGAHFKTAGQASRYRKRVRVPPKKGAADIERVKRYGRQYWVRRLYEAMIDVSDLIDKETSIHRIRFQKNAHFDPLDLEATAHHIFESAIAVHERGWNRPISYHKKVVRGKLFDISMNSVESRLSRICELLKLSKAAVDDAIRGGVTLALLCDNPAARLATKESNNAGNDKRARSLAYVSSLEAAQGAPLSDKQLADALKRFEQMERERDQAGANAK